MSEAKLQALWYSSSLWTKLLLPFHILLLLIINLRRWLYSVGLLKSYQSTIPIIIVGNISVGGTGKTPFIKWFIKFLAESGLKVAIVSRGYGGKARQYPLLVSDNTPVEACGDEPKLLGNSFSGLILVDPNRVRAVKWLEQHASETDVIILDDGLQHYALSRDIEVCLVDGLRMHGNKMLLPVGPLREPIGRLKKCDVIIKNMGNESLDDGLIHHMSIQPKSFVNLKTHQSITPNEFKTSLTDDCLAVCAIGNPHKFTHTLDNIGLTYTLRAFSDHYPFSKSDFNAINNKNIIMTEKDAVKCRPFADQRFWYLDIEPKPNDSLLDELEKIKHYLIARREQKS